MDWRIIRRRIVRWLTIPEYITDLRLIKIEERHRYREFFYMGVGHAIGALLRAYDAGHLKSQSPRSNTP